jgi:hypothetical protein
MGTSQSSSGPGGSSPLVPPWADDEPQKPLPTPPSARFAPFRRSLGRFLKTNNQSDLRSALSHYASKGTGGGDLASRRLGSVTNAGATLYGMLSSLAESKVPPDVLIDLDNLKGQPCDIAIDIITRSLATNDGDTEKIRVAMNHALVEALDGIAVFDPTNITDDIIITIMINYLSEAVFLQIVMDAGKAWTNAETATQAVTAENTLRELIKVIVDKNMAPRLKKNTRTFTKQEMKTLQREVIKIAWKEWEGYQ